MKFFTIYKITNKINGKYYIGAHETYNLDDGYMGSGTTIRKAISKYGLDNFEKEYIQFHKSSEEMYLSEKDVIGDLWLNDKLCYNEKPGGIGGWGYVDSYGEKNCMKRKDVVNKVSNSLKEKYKSDSVYAAKLIENLEKATYAAAEKRRGQTDSEETKRKRAESLKQTARGKKPKYLLIDYEGNEFKYATLTECCEIHDLNRNVLYRWLNKGKIEKTVHATRISLSAINTYGWEIKQI